MSTGEAFELSMPADVIERMANEKRTRDIAADRPLAPPRRRARPDDGEELAPAPELPLPAPELPLPAPGPARFASASPAPFFAMSMPGQLPPAPPAERQGLSPAPLGTTRQDPTDPSIKHVVRSFGEFPAANTVGVCLAAGCAGKTWNNYDTMIADHVGCVGDHRVAQWSSDPHPTRGDAIGLLTAPPLPEPPPAAPVSFSMPAFGPRALRYDDPALWAGGVEALTAPRARPPASAPRPRAVDHTPRPRAGVINAAPGARLLVHLDDGAHVLEVYSLEQNAHLAPEALPICLHSECTGKTWPSTSAMVREHASQEVLAARGQAHVVVLLAKSGDGSPVLFGIEEVES